ncbi:MAG: hypothetical protein ABW167_04190 [Baekduia sp.]
MDRRRRRRPILLGWYKGGKVGGYVTIAAVTGGRAGNAWGPEFDVGQTRLAPFGAPKGKWWSRLPHYHRGRYGPEGAPLPGRHRPWQPKSPDTSFRDRF